MRTLITLTSLGLVLSLPATTAAATAEPDSARTLRATDEVSELESLTVEAENRVQIHFERPQLRVDIDPSTAPGLDWGSIVDVLDRQEPDLRAPLLASSAGERSPYLARPWLDGFREGPVARFKPQMDGVSGWKLAIADSRGREVRTFVGSGNPPKQLEWDGKTDDGGYAQVGLVYSFVLTAHDRAGNKRNFVGDSFELPAYRRGEDGQMRFLFTAAQLRDGQPVPELLQEIATRVNRVEDADLPVKVTVTARTRAEAEATGRQIEAQFVPMVIDGSRRVMVVTDVATDAPQTVGLDVALGR